MKTKSIRLDGPVAGVERTATSLERALTMETKMTSEHDGEPLETNLRPRRFHSWLGWNCLATLVCLPLGIPGLIFSIKALNARRRGDLALSDYHAKSARAFFWFAILLGLPVALFYLLFSLGSGSGAI